MLSSLNARKPLSGLQIPSDTLSRNRRIRTLLPTFVQQSGKWKKAEFSVRAVQASGPHSLTPHPASSSFLSVAKTLTFSESASARIVVLVGENSKSTFQNGGDTIHWKDVMQHMARRIDWIQSGLEMLVFSESEAIHKEYKNTKDNPSASSKFNTALSAADLFIVVALKSQSNVQEVENWMSQVKTSICLGGCCPQLSAYSKLGGVTVGQLSPLEIVSAKLGLFPTVAQSFKVMKMVTNAWDRCHPDDIWFSILLLVDAYATEVTSLKSLRAQDLTSVQCMVDNCSSQIWDCLKDSNCRKAIGCLTSCGPTDQVCSYQCIVSYESPALEAFTLCTLQKNNCLSLNAEIRTQPYVVPMGSFRGQNLTHSLAEDLLVGWLGEKEFSWRVVAGQNAAYDQFPCQYQIFYRGKAKGTVWYDPVFIVQTLEGVPTWRRRHYRVRRDKVPGTFWFTTLDNGVISKEFWTIVDVDEDLAWALFYYSGAAAAAGQSYTGAVLISQDGKWPSVDHETRIEFALERCGIKMWELFRVNNSNCNEPPLGLPEDAPSVLSVISVPKIM